MTGVIGGLPSVALRPGTHHPPRAPAYQRQTAGGGLPDRGHSFPILCATFAIYRHFLYHRPPAGVHIYLSPGRTCKQAARRGRLGGHALCRIVPSVRWHSLTHTFVDLGMSPLCESYVPASSSMQPEVFYPLHVRLCSPASWSSCRRTCPVRTSSPTTPISPPTPIPGSRTRSVRRVDDQPAEPDPGQPGDRGGQQRRLPAPAFPRRGHSRARRRAGRERGRGGPGPRHRTGPVPRAPRPARRSPSEYGQADLVAANNVFAHVPDIRGFAAGLRALVKDTGLVTLEFPHLLRLIERRQFDTIYHEHYSYLSLLTAVPGPGDRRADGRRRRGAEHARRIAAGPRPSRGNGGRADHPGQSGARPRRSRRACTPSAGHAGFAAEC